jgi:outer membrane protein assembly factor BamE (lipoprotein component of BamABCDE complex)
MTTRTLFGLVAICASLTVAGCVSAPPSNGADRLTVGKVQGEIKVGMDAASVAQVLGSPNIITTDEQRREVWIYDKVSSDRVDQAGSVYGTLIIVGGAYGTHSSSSTQRTLTIIIKYDEQKRVRDFAYNYSQF